MIKFRTGTPQEVRRTLSRVVNMVANKEMDSKTANAITVCCNAILSSMRIDEQQKHIEELADLLDEVIKHREEN